MNVKSKFSRLVVWLAHIHPHTHTYHHLTIKLTAVELHADCSLAVPVDWVEPNKPSNHRRKENVFLCFIGLLVPREYLVKDGDKIEKK